MLLKFNVEEKVQRSKIQNWHLALFEQGWIWLSYALKAELCSVHIQNQKAEKLAWCKLWLCNPTFHMEWENTVSSEKYIYLSNSIGHYTFVCNVSMCEEWWHGPQEWNGDGQWRNCGNVWPVLNWKWMRSILCFDFVMILIVGFYTLFLCVWEY